MVPVKINGAVTLNFVIDSGLADVSVPADVVLSLIRTGMPSEYTRRMICSMSKLPYCMALSFTSLPGVETYSNFPGAEQPARELHQQQIGRQLQVTRDRRTGPDDDQKGTMTYRLISALSLRALSTSTISIGGTTTVVRAMSLPLMTTPTYNVRVVP